MIEYAIWGNPPGKTKQDLLVTRITDKNQLKKIKKELMEDHGCAELRVQTIDLSRPFDFMKTVMPE